MERLQKVMAHAGVASRRKSEEMIQQGRVRVNGQVITELGFKVFSADHIEVDGKEIKHEEKVYFLFNKPTQVITSLHDEYHRKTVKDFFIEVPERIYPVGRLDYDTHGLLIMTNDGELANRLSHPSYEVKKTYLAHVHGHVDEQAIQALENGIELEDGMTAPAQAQVKKIWTQPARSLVALTIHEGRNHQVKRMMQAVGYPVYELYRTHFGPISLGKLAEGEYRDLKSEELKELRRLVDLQTS